MPLDPIDLLLEELVTTGRGRWPTPRELKVTRTVATWRAFLESDRELLREIADWPKDRAYKVDPLAELIADAWADHLFDEDLDITESSPSDHGALDALLEANPEFNGDVHEAARRVVALGEEYWRGYIDRDIADAPLLEWHSRDVVVPLYIGRRLIAAALVTELARTKGRYARAVYRHFEIHADGVVEHVLFRGSKTRIGETVPLEEHPELVDLASELGAANGEGQRWEHGLPMLMGRVTNGRRIDRKLNVGISDYARITDQLLDLNEATTIAGENVRLTAKKRIVVPESALEHRRAPFAGDLEDRGDGFLIPSAAGGTFDAGEDVYVTSQLDKELGRGNDSPIKVLEYSFDALPLLAHKRDVVETALTRVALTPQYVGVADDAPGVLSGTAYRLKLIPTTKGGKGKGRPWDDTLPHVLMLLAMLDALPEEQGGFGRSWAAAAVPPAVERTPGLPRDEVEEANIEVALTGAGLRSKFTSISAQHPDWSEQEVNDEIQRIKDEAPTSAAGAGLGDLGFGA